MNITSADKIPVSSVIWATGFKPNYTWLNIPGTLAVAGEPRQHKGISAVAGVYWISLPWQFRMNSGIINGLGHDAKYIVDHIKMLRNEDKGVNNIEEIHSKITRGDAILLDVRTEAEWLEEHALSAVHIPVNRIESEYKTKLNPELPVYIYCGSGKRASVAKKILDEGGFSAINIGGLTDWKKAGGETVIGKR